MRLLLSSSRSCRCDLQPQVGQHRDGTHRLLARRGRKAWSRATPPKVWKMSQKKRSRPAARSYPRRLSAELPGTVYSGVLQSRE